MCVCMYICICVCKVQDYPSLFISGRWSANRVSRLVLPRCVCIETKDSERARCVAPRASADVASTA